MFLLSLVAESSYFPEIIGDLLPVLGVADKDEIADL